MTRTEQEHLVEQYLRGELSAVEEHDFFIQVALDSDLRQTLKAFRVVDSALQKHRSRILPDQGEAFQQFMLMLAPATQVEGERQPVPSRPSLRSALRDMFHISAIGSSWKGVALVVGILLIVLPGIAFLITRPDISDTPAIPDDATVEVHATTLMKFVTAPFIAGLPVAGDPSSEEEGRGGIVASSTETEASATLSPQKLPTNTSPTYTREAPLSAAAFTTPAERIFADSSHLPKVSESTNTSGPAEHASAHQKLGEVTRKERDTIRLRARLVFDPD